MKNILIATDLTANCDRALERAIKLAKLTGGKLHILNVAPVYLLPGKKKETEPLKQDTEELIRSYLSGYAGAKTVKTAIHVIEGGEAYAKIINASQKLKADLIVMGVHNKIGFRDLFVGTTIERVIRIGFKPVLMVKDKPKGDYKSVLAGSDFSESCKKTFYSALQLAPGAAVSLVHTYDFPDTLIGDKIDKYAGEVIENIEAEQLEEFAKESQKTLEKYNIPAKKFSCKTVKGAPFDVLVAEAKKAKAELLAIGVHSRTSFAHSKLGGVAGDILTNPPCDVLISKGLTKV